MENGALAVEAVRHSRYDLGLIDIQMPVMDGLEAIRAIRAEERAKGAPRLPLVVLSANVMPEHLAASRAAGADNHIGKPVRADELAEAIARALQGGDGRAGCWPRRASSQPARAAASSACRPRASSPSGLRSEQ